MQKLLNLTLGLLVAGMAMSGCKKTKEDELTIVNRVAEELTFDVYSSMEAYTAGNAPLMRKVLPASDKLVLMAKELNANTTYYVDWYNEDYTRNNWFNDEYPNNATTVAMKTTAGSSVYYTTEATTSGGRNVFLNGGGTGSSWIAIDAFLYSANTGFVSVWQNVPDNERYQTMDVSKGFTAAYGYKDANGDVKSTSLKFKVHNTKAGYIEMFGADGSAQGYMISGRLPGRTAPEYYSASTDSLLALLPNSEMQFLMVKKK